MNETPQRRRKAKKPRKGLKIAILIVALVLVFYGSYKISMMIFSPKDAGTQAGNGVADVNISDSDLEKMEPDQLRDVIKDLRKENKELSDTVKELQDRIETKSANGTATSTPSATPTAKPTQEPTQKPALQR